MESATGFADLMIMITLLKSTQHEHGVRSQEIDIYSQWLITKHLSENYYYYSSSTCMQEQKLTFVNTLSVWKPGMNCVIHHYSHIYS